MALGWRQTGGRDALAPVERWLEAERDQLALWLPVALGIGIAGWFVLPSDAARLGFGVVALGLATAGLALGIGRRVGRALAWGGLVAAAGCLLIAGKAAWVAAPKLERPAIATFSASVETIDRLPARGLVRLVLAPAAGSDLPPRVRVNVANDDLPAGFVGGDRIGLRARLMPPPGAALPGSYDFARVAWFEGIGATGRALGPVRVIAETEAGGFAMRLAALRGRLTAHIQAQLPGVAGGIAAAFVTGDTGAIPEEDAEAMRRAGLAHLLSISGLHVTAVVAGTMLLVLRLLALSPTLALRAPLPLVAAGAGALAGIGYTLLSGGQVPTIRSCVAALLVLAGLALGREAITLRLVAAGALIVLLLWPEALAGPSFQLSFAAVIAIVALNEHPRMRAWFGRREEGWGPRLLRGLGSLLLTGLVIEAVLAPVALYHFHRAGVLGAFANIVAIPLTTFVIMPLEALALLLDVAGIGAPLWWLAGRALGLLLALAHVVAAAPGAVARLPSMPNGAFALMLAGGLWLALWRTRVRVLGLLPIVIGAGWALATPPPDLLVTGDGRHLALRRADGGLALLRPRAGDYVRDMLGENGGSDEPALEIDRLAEARCSADLCLATLGRGGRRWTLLATRSRHSVTWRSLVGACADADIVVSDRRLPDACRPRWLKADRALLARTGGLAITLAGPTVKTVAERTAGRPWAQPGPPLVIPAEAGIQRGAR